MNKLKTLGRRFDVGNTIHALTVLLVFVSVLFELHFSIVQEIYSSFGKFDDGTFIQIRLLVGAAVIALTFTNIAVNQWRLVSVTEFKVYIFFILYMASIVWLNRDEYAYIGLDEEQTTSALEFWSPKLFKYMVYFCIGVHLFSTLRFRFFYLIFTILAAAVILMHVNPDTLGIDKNAYIESANKGNYLFLGDAMALCCMLMLVSYKNTAFRVMFLSASLIVIFLIGSRTSFVVYFGSCILYFGLLFNARYLPLVAGLAIALNFAVQQINFTDVRDKNVRMTSIFTDYEDDQSVRARKHFAEIGWEDIKGSPILGKFGGQRDVAIFGARPMWHNYMHSVFSYWRQFGILALGILLYFVYTFIRSMQVNLSKRNTTTYGLVFLIGVYTVTEVAISRSFAFASAHMLLGVIVWYSYIQARNNIKTSAGVGKSISSNEMPIRKKKRRRKKRSSIKF